MMRNDELSSDSGQSIVRSSDPAEVRAVETAIALPAHVVQAKGHGHAGTAMALAPVAHVLYSRVLHHDPADPSWEGRDRVILSAGHASLLLYVQLLLTGYGLEPSDLERSRGLDSRTPGHPELGHTPGIELSTGPLGQGVASAVGVSLAARRDEALHGAGTGLFDPTVWVIAGDGCLEEGVSGEASSLAGTLGLDNLVMLWDDNRITIDGPTDLAFTEDVRARYRAYGWRVLEIDDPLDLDAVEGVLREARERTGRPTFVAIRTTIGFPSPARAGTAAAHAGAFGVDDVAEVKRILRFPPDAGLDDLIPDEVLAHTRQALDRGARLREEWLIRFAQWERTHRVEASRRRVLARGGDPEALSRELDAVAAEIPGPGASVATRATNGKVLVALAPQGVLWGGSADLSESTSVAVPGTGVDAANPGGDFIRFGVREHAMAAILTGIAVHGLWRPFGSTYLAFSDYQRPSIRLTALMRQPVVYVYTHDSVAVGEDGPTHQPVEQIASLRTVPHLDVVRPADAHEVVGVWRRLLSERSHPTALILSRQGVPVAPSGTAADPESVARGAYVAWMSGHGTDAAILATGSELSLAIEAAKRVADEGVQVRVISMPCETWFERESAEYRHEVLPSSLRARVAVEAGRGAGWYKWVGLDGVVVSVEDFGESGPGAAVLERRGITMGNVVEAVRRVVAGV
jgi:transketolase